MRIGSVIEIWRYPVKSMGGQRLDTASVGCSGLAGDRHWAVLDTRQTEIRSAKRWPELLRYNASYSGDDSPGTDDYDAQVQNVTITAPDGQQLGSDQPNCDEQLSDWLGRSARLSRRRPAHERDHYRLARARTDAITHAELGLFEDETPPDYSAMSAEVMGALADCVTPPGVYVDAFPLHLLSRNALTWLAARSALDTDVRRFRPNLLVEVDGAGDSAAEDRWLGAHLGIGETLLRVDSRTVRCAMPGRPQPLQGLAAQPALVRALVDHCQRCLGLNIVVERPGLIRAGDPIFRLD
ncbi:MAG: MOSC N-terminal beta barrel domain-containing protein [Halioglobus sp.]|nr:MOSC N-terminal beta barrel domain-containing protein [Halioglobus sp.]